MSIITGRGIHGSCIFFCFVGIMRFLGGYTPGESLEMYLVGGGGSGYIQEKEDLWRLSAHLDGCLCLRLWTCICLKASVLSRYSAGIDRIGRAEQRVKRGCI